MAKNLADQKIRLLEKLELNVLDKGKIKNAKLAKEIARRWAKL